MEEMNSKFYTKGKKIRFTIESYENVGKELLISLLDIFQRNPYSRFNF